MTKKNNIMRQLTIEIKNSQDVQLFRDLIARLGFRLIQEREVISIENKAITDTDWLTAIANNTAFDFLQDEAEDIYTLADGKPLQ